MFSVPPEIPTWYVGQHLPSPELPASDDTIQNSIDSNYDFITSYISNSLVKERVQQSVADASSIGEDHVKIGALEQVEVLLFPGERISQIIAYASPWLELDSSDPLIAQASRQVLLHEIAYAAFCGISKVVIKGPRSLERSAQFAEAIKSALGINAFMQFLIEYSPVVDGVQSNVGQQLDIWDSWNTIRSINNYHPAITLSLHVPPVLPSSRTIDRWFSEPVRQLFFSSRSFVLNAKGYPVLSKSHQALLTKYMRIQPTPYIVLADTLQSLCTEPSSLTGASARPAPKVRRDEPLSFITYIRHLQKSQPPPDVWESMGPGYQDYLQSPLQPLADNLESLTYEVFEKDPVKYNQYENAIKLALNDRNPETEVIVAVCGAGRGPLVSRALRAADATGRKIKLFAIEKNPNAYVYLQRHNQETWNGKVTLVKTDMRVWNPPQPIDILISELLGSFGDNELSPECLDGAQRVLNPDGGISIPQSYTAHFTPLMAPKIFTELANKDAEAKEIPYVVMLHAIDYLAEGKRIQQAWEFTHPREHSQLGDESNHHNTRFCQTTFTVPWRGVMHGIGGYFESVLYGNVELSTRPDTINEKSADMTSWFPIFFPLKTPLYIPDSSEVDITMWRKTDERKVWYEWVAETYILLSGKRVRLGQSQIHSSERSGCLM